MANRQPSLRLLAPTLFLFALMGVVPGARAATNLFNLYVGAGLGHAQLKARNPSLIISNPGSLGSFDRNDTAYQFMAGVRGLYLLGAEADYYHLGSGSVSPSFSGVGAIGNARVSQKGEAAFAVLYLPIPVPMLDVFLKAGVARITSDLSASLTPSPSLPLPPGGGTNTYAVSETTSGLAAGAGVQWSFGNWAVRGEYQRFNALGEHPDLLTVGVTWSLL